MAIGNSLKVKLSGSVNKITTGIIVKQTVTKNRILISLVVIMLVTTSGLIILLNQRKYNDPFVTYTVDTQKQAIKLYWKNDKQENIRSIHNLNYWLDEKQLTLVFAMNAGMYKKDYSPQGLYIENKKLLNPLDTSNGAGNFYVKPNGVFYITDDNFPFICTTPNFKDNGRIKYATQSGPMLVTDGQIHHSFKKGSTNLNIRNGVGILPNNRVIFAMSKEEINFYDFAEYFKSMGCKNALYLDGHISQTYLPEQDWVQTDGKFGVIIGVTENKQ